MEVRFFSINTDGLDKIMEFLPFIIPLFVIQLGLIIFAIVDIARKKQTKNLSPLIWIIIAIFGQFLGSILYLVFGRAESGKNDDIDDI